MVLNRNRKILPVLIVLLLVGSVGFVTWKNSYHPSPEPWSVIIAKSEMKRSPEAWMINFSKKLNWNYCHGLMGKAFLDVYDQYKTQSLYDYIKCYADTMIFENGQIYGYRPDEYNLDRLNTGRILFKIYDVEKNEKYRKALDIIRSQLNSHPRTSEGGFWHKKVYQHQIWLDGLYMEAPFYAQYSQLINDTSAFSDIANQFLLVRKHLFDPSSDLYRQGWDESKSQLWADSITGQSPSVWGRSMGWYAMGLVDVLDFIPVNHPDRNKLISIYKEMVNGIISVQDKESGLWYQIMDKGKKEGNYLESSCSAMFIYSILKGIRMGYIESSYKVTAIKAYDGFLNKFIIKNNDGTYSITDACVVGGLGGKPYRDGSYHYYINDPVRDNDPKAVGAFIMASIEFERL